MMDAVKFLKEKNRMCNKYKNCFECPVGTKNGGCQTGTVRDQEVTEEELISIVETWAAEYPVKTRQSEFLKMYPNADFSINGTLLIMPCDIDKNYNRDSSGYKICDRNNCTSCRKEYWLAEVK